MIPIYTTNHRHYKQRCRIFLQNSYPNLKIIPNNIRKAINMITYPDLSYIDDIMRNYYSKYGPAPRPASCMLRSLLLAMICKVTSITQWVDILHTQPLYAVISGFEPDNIPGVGTFYDFINRLWKLDTNNISSHIKFPKRKPSNPSVKGDKAAPVEKNTVTEELEATMSGQSPISAHQPFSLLFKIFEHFLLISHTQGLINLNSLQLAGDGTPVVTASRERSKAIVKGARSYEHPLPRYYSQPDCDIGWDSYRECYYSGYDLYVLTDVNNGLPIFPLLNPASRHDSFCFLHTWSAMKKHMPYAKINSAYLDSAHDAMAIHKYFQEEKIHAFIDLGRVAKPSIREGFHLDKDFRPICPAGYRMHREGNDYKHMRIKFTCPLAIRKDNTRICRCENPCTTAKSGAMVYLSRKDNPRLFTTPSRDSSECRREYRKRTSVERSNKSMKVDYLLEHGRHRSSKMWYFRLYCIMMCQHLNAWKRPLGSEVW